MREDLLNAVSNLVQRHVLRELHDMTGALLAQLDAGDVAISFNELDPPAPVKLPRASTIARKERRRRAQQRQAATIAAIGAVARVTAAPAGHWPVLRTEFHAAIKVRHLSRGQVAAEIGVSKGSICGWLLPHGAPPSADNIVAIRAWLDKPVPQSETALVPETPTALDDWPALREKLRTIIRDRGLTHAAVGAVLDVEGSTLGSWIAQSHSHRTPGARALIRIREWLGAGAGVPVAAAADAPPFVLSEAEKSALIGHLALAGSARDIRDHFGVTRELAEQAASGAHLHADVIARLRGVLANGVAEGS